MSDDPGAPEVPEVETPHLPGGAGAPEVSDEPFADFRQLALGDLEQEIGSTRRVLEAMPADRMDFRPHEKSWTMGELATHIANIPTWTPSILTEEEYDLASGPPPADESLARDEVLETFDANVAKQREALAGVDDFARPWTLRKGDHVIFEMPRMMVFRVMGISHMIHHRAQLTMYLRMLDVPVPGMYGPSADEKEQ